MLFQEKFKREQEELKAKHEMELLKAKILEEELRKQVCAFVKRFYSKLFCCL
jgi:hypothetical protein